MNVIGQMNILLEGFGILVSLIILIVLLTGTDRKSTLNRLFMRIVLCNIAALFCDAVAWFFDGNVSMSGFVIVRVAKFSSYSFAFFLIPLLTDYIVELINRNVKISRTIVNVMYLICSIIVSLGVLSQWNNMYYYFDENNRYQARDLFWLSQVFALLLLAIDTAIILRYWKSLIRSDAFFLLSYSVFPLLAMIIHVITFTQLEYIHIAATLSIVAIYGGIQARQAKLLKDRELELTESRIAIMLSQIQPHFLYNSLVAIKHLCLTDPKLAAETVVEFSDYLRVNLDSLAIKKPITFEQELRHVANYLSIEKKRFGDKLNVVYDIRVKDFTLPALALQLIVENAVRYGVTKKEQGGTVTIRTEESEHLPDEHSQGSKKPGDHKPGGYVVISVSDDGEGFHLSNRIIKSDNERSHVGLENVRNRLSIMCGGTLEIKSKLGIGTTAIMTIPKLQVDMGRIIFL